MQFYETLSVDEELHIDFLQKIANPSFSPSAMVSGNGLPSVSGKIKDKIPAQSAAAPKNNGACGPIKRIYGANIVPIEGNNFKFRGHFDC